MLDVETKRRIDTARDILVGKVTDPKSQVEQITIALIYKFMDDLDMESEELGGQRKFFVGEFSRYRWAKLMSPGLGGYETLKLYAEAIAKMQENPGVPALFRNIFKNAYLPYSDPEILRAFLKVINEFTYDHSERLGDAFEYILSVLGSQGSAGQFRTPRHIIDFIVAIIDPKKDETVLDPACGTAGFLVSSYKHILGTNTDTQGHSMLTLDERSRLAKNFMGYEISPDMVRLSLVNMYLHGFANPHIFEYDTLSSEDHWNDYVDVVLANPPFMSPKGGIKPHKRFSVKSRRSEVLFVDYIANHLKHLGRAGIIVPEGIIFKNQNAYKQLRKTLVEEFLVVVVSLPNGVFKPYSGVKTSILILDKSLAKKANSIAFFKVENDGFELGDQRRPIKQNDLPQAREKIAEYLQHLQSGRSMDDYRKTIEFIIEKERIATSDSYNLTAESYKKAEVRKHQKWPMMELGEICEIFSGKRPKGGAVNSGVLSIGGEHINSDGNFNLLKPKYIPEKFFKELKKGKLETGDVLVVKDGATTGKTGYFHKNAPFKTGAVNEHVFILRPDPKKIESFYLYQFLKSQKGNSEILKYKTGTAQGGVNLSIKKIKIPLPPLKIQREIVEQIEVKQNAITHAKEVIKNLERERDDILAKRL